MRPPDASARTCAQVLESVARGLRAGRSLSVALDRAVDGVVAGDIDDTSTPRDHHRHDADRRVDPCITDALRRHRTGAPLADCLAAAQAHCRTDEPVRLTVTVLWIAAGHGGASSEALDRTATVLREHAALADDARTQASPARLSSTMLTLSPLVFCAGAAALDGDVRHVLTATPVGWTCLTGGLALAALGRHWMSRLVEGAA